jgi:hypothetical protein
LKPDTGEGGELTGLRAWTEQDFIAFKNKRIYAIKINTTDPATWPIVPMTDDIGCVAHGSIQQFGGDLLFLAQDGVRSVLQSAEGKKLGAGLAISDPIRDVIETINWQYAKDTCASTVWRGQYMLAVPTGANQTPNKLLVYNPFNQSWDVRSIAIGAFAIGRFNDLPKLYSALGGTTGGIRIEDSTFNDDGTAMTWSLESKAISGENGKPLPNIWKRGGEIEVFFEASGAYVVTVQARGDGAEYTTVGTVTLTGALPTLPIDLPFYLAEGTVLRKKFNYGRIGRFRNAQFKFTNAETGAEIRFIRAIVTMLPAPYTRDN